MGFGQDLGNFIESVGTGLGAAAPFLLPLFGRGAPAPVFFPSPGPVAQPFPTPTQMQLPGGFNGVVPIRNISDEVLGPPPQLQLPTGGGSPIGALFRMTASGRVRPVNRATILGPDGQCHTFLHATPKGWKVNVSNVSGRRRHHHHRP